MVRPKILATSYLFPNRVMKNHGIFVFNRLKAMSQYMDVTVINPIPWFPLQGVFRRYSGYNEIPFKEDIDGLTVYHPRYFSIPKYLKHIEGSTYYRAIKPIAEDIYQRNGFDLIDMHWTFPDLPAGLQLAKEYDVPTCVTLRGMEAFHLQDNDSRQHIVKQGLEQVDKIIALSNELKITGDAAAGNSTKSHVIRNGVDTDIFRYLPQQECRAILNIAAHEKIIISVGSLIFRKGFDLIIKALAEIKKKSDSDNVKLYIVGSEGAEGDYRTALYDLIDTLELKDSIVFVGQVPNHELKTWYNAADVFCLASRGEGSPNVLTEALACGCPAVTADVGAAKEIIQQKDGLGFCVPVDNVKELTAALDQSLKTAFNRSANAEYLHQFNWNWCAKQVAEVIAPAVSASKEESVELTL